MDEIEKLAAQKLLVERGLIDLVLGMIHRSVRNVDTPPASYICQLLML